MTTYIYKNQEISHTHFISILRSVGINGGRRLSHLEVLNREAENGNERAIEIIKNLEVIKDSNRTYDVVFNDESDSSNKGFKSSLDYCKSYIKDYNGTNESYFSDYKGGTVSIVCNETGEEVHSEVIK